MDCSLPGSSVHRILQAKVLECVAISFSNAWKWKVKVKSLSRVRLLATPWTAAYQAPQSMGFSRQEYWSGVPLPSPKEEITQNEIIRGHSKVWASKGGSEGWALQCGRPGFDPWVGKIPWRRIQAAYSSILAWRSPWSPWAHKQSDTTERLSLSVF